MVVDENRIAEMSRRSPAACVGIVVMDVPPLRCALEIHSTRSPLPGRQGLNRQASVPPLACMVTSSPGDDTAAVFAPVRRTHTPWQ